MGGYGMHPIPQLGKGNLFVVIDKTHKVNNVSQIMVREMVAFCRINSSFSIINSWVYALYFQMAF